VAQPSARFAAGSAFALYSGVWRLIVNKNDIYLGASKGAMSSFKVSLHKSGVWVLAATKESRATFEKGNRRATRWLRPSEHAPGVTRGPSIFVPHTITRGQAGSARRDAQGPYMVSWAGARRDRRIQPLHC
jgi:hypothetical protein